MSDLRNRFFLAQSKVKHFQTKYGKSLEELDRDRLHDDADYKMHEDYIFWHHWRDAAVAAEQEIIGVLDIGYSVESS